MGRRRRVPREARGSDGARSGPGGIRSREPSRIRREDGWFAGRTRRRFAPAGEVRRPPIGRIRSGSVRAPASFATSADIIPDGRRSPGRRRVLPKGPRRRRRTCRAGGGQAGDGRCDRPCRDSPPAGCPAGSTRRGSRAFSPGRGSIERAARRRWGGGARRPSPRVPTGTSGAEARRRRTSRIARAWRRGRRRSSRDVRRSGIRAGPQLRPAPPQAAKEKLSRFSPASRS